MTGAEKEPDRFKALTGFIGGLTLIAAKHAKVTLLFVLILTGVLGAGLARLHTNVDVADVLPRGDYNTTAAHELTKDFKSAFTLQITLQFHVDANGAACGAQWAKDNRERIPNRQTPARCGNITDEVYVRAIAQMVDFMKANDGLVCCSIAVSDLFKLINWTVGDPVTGGGTKGDAKAYALPKTDLPGEIRYRTVNDAANQAIMSAIDALASPSWRNTAILLTPKADTTATTADIGEKALEARDAYRKWVDENPREAYQVFGGENYPRLTVELPVANAHSSALTKADFTRLFPIVAGFILLILFVAFRNLGAVLIAFTALTINTTWTYGLEGYMGIALNPLNLTLLPLIMGIGIDYSIHITNEFQEHKAAGLTNEEAFRQVGRRGGTALFIATLTTVVGLLVMVVSPSVLIAQFGLLAALSISIMFVLVLTFIPAALAVHPHPEKMGASFRPSGIAAALARGVSKFRGFTIVAILVLSVLGTVGATKLQQEPFGDPGRNYLRSDPIRQEHEEGLKWFYDSPQPDIKANVITFQGDLTDPQAHAYMRAIESELKKQPRVVSDTLRTIPFLMETWLTVKDGGQGAVAYLAQGSAGAPPYPATRDDMKREFDALYTSPVRELGSIFTNGPGGHYSLGVMTFSVRAATYSEAADVWHQVWKSIESAKAKKPAGLKVAFVGNTATNYLFVAKEVPWVAYMGTASNLFLAIFLIPFFRSWRAFLAIMVVNFATTAWWLGLLPLLDIGLAITLVLPLIFISAVGTDYAVHLVWAMRDAPDTRRVWATTGKAVLFSWITTIGPFVIFMGIQDLSVRKTMIATVLAITIIFVCTLMTVPSFYRVRSARESAALQEAPPRSEEPFFEAESTVVAVRSGET